MVFWSPIQLINLGESEDDTRNLSLEDGVINHNKLSSKINSNLWETTYSFLGRRYVFLTEPCRLTYQR
jgi:hypothetical protein